MNAAASTSLHLSPPSSSSPSSRVPAIEDEETLDVGSVPSACLPFRPAARASLTLDQHAACFAELTVWPHAAAAIHARYHLEDEGRRLVEFRYWADQRRRDPALDVAWGVRFDSYTRYYMSDR